MMAGTREQLPSRLGPVSIDSHLPRWLNRLAIRPSHQRNRALRQVAESLASGGFSSHSSAGDTLPFLIAYLEDRRIPYVLTAQPGQGYQLSTRKDK